MKKYLKIERKPLYDILPKYRNTKFKDGQWDQVQKWAYAQVKLAGLLPWNAQMLHYRRFEDNEGKIIYVEAHYDITRVLKLDLENPSFPHKKWSENEEDWPDIVCYVSIEGIDIYKKIT